MNAFNKYFFLTLFVGLIAAFSLLQFLMLLGISSRLSRWEEQYLQEIACKINPESDVCKTKK
jgi:hypothetical protein